MRRDLVFWGKCNLFILSKNGKQPLFRQKLSTKLKKSCKMFFKTFSHWTLASKRNSIFFKSSFASAKTVKFTPTENILAKHACPESKCFFPKKFSAKIRYTALQQIFFSLFPLRSFVQLQRHRLHPKSRRTLKISLALSRALWNPCREEREIFSLYEDFPGQCPTRWIYALYIIRTWT